MMDIMLTSSIMILAICALRKLCMGRISRRVQYGIWLAVALRLLIPVSFFENPFSPMAGFWNEAKEIENFEILQTGIAEEESGAMAEPAAGGAENSQMNGKLPAVGAENLQMNGELPAVNEENPYLCGEPPVAGEGSLPQESGLNESLGMVSMTVGEVFRLVRWLGIMIFALVVGISNVVFFGRLRKTRKKVGVHENLTVYESEQFGTPCLYGFFRPSIYVTGKSMETEESREMVLLHESTHYRHLDHIWAMVRCLCVVLYWFHPLVWLAAVLSVRDSELACDESVLRKVGEPRRKEYGELILSLADGVRERGISYCSTGMTGGAGGLRERIRLIAQKKKIGILLSVVVLLAVVVLFVGAFGKMTAGEQESQGIANGLHKTCVACERSTVYMIDQKSGTMVKVNCDDFSTEPRVTRLFEADAQVCDDVWLWDGGLYFLTEKVSENGKNCTVRLESYRLESGLRSVVTEVSCAKGASFAMEGEYFYYPVKVFQNGTECCQLQRFKVTEPENVEELCRLEADVPFPERMEIGDAGIYGIAEGRLCFCAGGLAGGAGSVEVIAQNVSDFSFVDGLLYYQIKGDGIYCWNSKDKNTQMFYSQDKETEWTIFAQKVGVVADAFRAHEQNYLIGLFSPRQGVVCLNEHGKVLFETKEFSGEFDTIAAAGSIGLIGMQSEEKIICKAISQSVWLGYDYKGVIEFFGERESDAPEESQYRGIPNAYAAREYYDMDLSFEENQQNSLVLCNMIRSRLRNEKSFQYRTTIDGVVYLGTVKPMLSVTAYAEPSGAVTEFQRKKEFVETIYNTQDGSCVIHHYEEPWLIEEEEKMGADNIYRRYRKYSLKEADSDKVKTFFTDVHEITDSSLTIVLRKYKGRTDYENFGLAGLSGQVGTLMLQMPGMAKFVAKYPQGTGAGGENSAKYYVCGFEAAEYGGYCFTAYDTVNDKFHVKTFQRIVMVETGENKRDYYFTNLDDDAKLTRNEIPDMETDDYIWLGAE